jgi:hypothetical protein
MPLILNRRLITPLILFGAMLLASAPSGAAQQSTTNSTPGWTWVQDSPVIFCGQLGSISSCTIGPGQIAPTKAGSIWIVGVTTPNNVTITSVTGGGGTWIQCPNCHVSNPAKYTVNAWYNLTGNAGTDGSSGKTITINLSGTSGAFMNVDFYEMLPPSGTTASYDDSGSVIGTNCTTCTGVALNNVTGTDIVIQNAGIAVAAWNSFSPSSWVVDRNGGAYNLNTTSGTAPTFTLPAANNTSTWSMAFKSSAGIFTPSTKNYSVVSFTLPTPSPTCNPTCNLTIPSTNAGDLLFVMAGNLGGTHINSVSGGGTWVVPSGANSCRINVVSTDSGELSCAYALSSTAGTTSISVTMSGTVNTGFGIWEIHSNTGLPFVFDTQASQVNAASFAPSGPALTLSGTNDVIFQGGFVPGGASGESYYPHSYAAHQSAYILFNEASESMLLDSGPTAPTAVWINPQNNITGGFGIAFTSGGTSALPNPPTGLTAIVH